MAKQVWKGSTLLGPVPPTLVTCGDGERANVFTVAWTGIVNTHPPMTYISVRPSRYSHELIVKSGEFVINLTTADLVKSADWCGVYTGKKVDKFAKCNLKTEPSHAVACPTLADSPLSLECKVKEVLHLGTHDMFLAEIVSISLDESLLDKNGKLDLSRANLAAFAHGEYFALGKKLGTFGFAVQKKTHKASQSKKGTVKPSHIKKQTATEKQTKR